MARVNEPRNSFSSGELSPRLYGREDTQQYAQGCAEITNFILGSNGGVYKRGPFEKINLLEINENERYSGSIIKDGFGETLFYIGEETYLVRFKPNTDSVSSDGLFLVDFLIYYVATGELKQKGSLPIFAKAIIDLVKGPVVEALPEVLKDISSSQVGNTVFFTCKTGRIPPLYLKYTPDTDLFNLYCFIPRLSPIAYQDIKYTTYTRGTDSYLAMDQESVKKATFSVPYESVSNYTFKFEGIADSYNYINDDSFFISIYGIKFKLTSKNNENILPLTSFYFKNLLNVRDLVQGTTVYTGREFEFLFHTGLDINTTSGFSDALYKGTNLSSIGANPLDSNPSETYMFSPYDVKKDWFSFVYGLGGITTYNAVVNFLNRIIPEFCIRLFEGGYSYVYNTQSLSAYKSAWDIYNGYPKYCSYTNGRLVFASTNKNPSTIWYSDVDDTFSFTKGFVQDTGTIPIYLSGANTYLAYINPWSSIQKVSSSSTDCFSQDILTKSGGRINWLVHNDGKLYVGMNDSLSVIASFNSGTFEPVNIKVLTSDKIRCSVVEPTTIDKGICFVEDTQRHLIRADYSTDTGEFTIERLTLLQDLIVDKSKDYTNSVYLGTGLFKSIVYSKDENILYALTNSGALVCLTYNLQSKVVGFYTFVSDLNFEYRLDTYIKDGKEHILLRSVETNSIYGSSRSYYNIQSFACNDMWITYIDGQREFDYPFYTTFDSTLEDAPIANYYKLRIFGIPFLEDGTQTSSVFDIYYFSYTQIGSGYFVGNGVLIETDMVNDNFLIPPVNDDNSIYIKKTFSTQKCVLSFIPKKLRLTNKVPLMGFYDGNSSTQLPVFYDGTFIGKFPIKLFDNSVSIFSLELPSECNDLTKVIVGNTYKCTLETLPTVMGGDGGSSMGNPKRIDRSTIRLFNACGGSVGINGNMYPIKNYTRLEEKVPYSGDINIPHPNQIDLQVSVTVEVDNKYPFELLSVSMRHLDNAN